MRDGVPFQTGKREFLINMSSTFQGPILRVSGALSLGYSGPIVKLIANFDLVLRLKIRGALPPPPSSWSYA